jgi:hypothetical protein
MKKLCLLLGIVILPYCAQSQSFDFGRYNFSLSSKILKDGSITDISLGMMYTETAGGQLRFRNTNISKNEELLGVADSLNAITENINEFYLLPIEYFFLNRVFPPLGRGRALL